MSIVFDPNNPKAVQIHTYLKDRISPDKIPANRMVVIGGDGFMLSCVREYDAQDRVFLGINCGHMGFLLNDLPADLAQLPILLCSDRLRVRTFPRIMMIAEDLEGRTVTASALNDVYLERTTGQGCHIRLRINGVVVVERMVCDGIVFSTALGSTAYAFSAGASPCHPSLSIIGVTPVCPHVPRLPPLYVPLKSSVEVDILNRELRPVRAVADGRDYSRVARLWVRDADAPVRLGFFPGHHFTATLVSKLLQV